MPARSPSRRRALWTWLALSPLVFGGACLVVPDLDEPEAAPVAPSTVQELLDRHIAASGGAEALRAIGQRTVEARVVFLAQEGCEEGDQSCVWEETSGTFVLYSTADARMYRRMVVGDNVLERGFDGETGWEMQAQPQMLIVEDPGATPVLREDARLHWYFDVEERDELALELLPSRTVGEGRELDGCVWFAASGNMPQAEKWFDRETGLLYEELERDTETGDTVLRIYEDYREVDGVMVPWLIRQVTETQGYPDHVVELRVQVVHHRDIEDKWYAIPELGPVEPLADPLLAELASKAYAAEAAPDDLIAQVAHARYAFAAAHFDEARAAAERALKIDKLELEALYILARIALLEGDLRDAEKRLRFAYSKGLRDEEVARQLAWIQLRRGEWAKAATELGKAGSAKLEQRYASFDGKPLAAKMGGDGCSTTVPIDVSGGAIVVEIGADGDRLRMLFDTGASDLLMSESQAHSLMIGTDAMAPLVAGGPPLRQGQLDTLTIGELGVDNVPVTLIPDDQMKTVVALDDVDGVLGIRPLAGRQLTIDRVAKTMEIVEPSRRCTKQLDANRVGTTIPYWVHETHYVYVKADMNGAEGVYLLNTGMRGADLTANEGAYAFAGIGAPPMHSGGIPGLARVDEFRIGELTRQDLGAAWGFLQQNMTSDGFRLDGMIGLGVFGGLTWTIDHDEQLIYLHPVSTADEPPMRGVPGGVPGGALPSTPGAAAPTSRPKPKPMKTKGQ